MKPKLFVNGREVKAAIDPKSGVVTIKPKRWQRFLMWLRIKPRKQTVVALYETEQ